MGLKNIEIERCDWRDIKTSVKEVNSQLFNVMEEASHSLTDRHLYSVSALFYEDLIVNGKSQLFELDKIDLDTNIDFNEFKSDFNTSNGQPLSLVLDGVVEIYNTNSYQYEGRGPFSYSFPLEIFKKGEVFGTFEAMDSLLEIKNFTYRYSASSGHHSIYPLIPDPNSGKKIYSKEVGSDWIERFRKEIAPNTDTPPSILDITPLMIRQIATESPYRTKLLLVPSHWFDHNNSSNRNILKEFIQSKAWFQSRKNREVEHNLMDRYREIQGKDSSYALEKAQFINYLYLAKSGRRPLLKFHPFTEFKYLEFINEKLKSMIHSYYHPFLMVYDYLEVDEKGILPICTLPFRTSSLIKIRNSSDFLDKLGDYLKNTDGELWEEMAKNTFKSQWKKNLVNNSNMEYTPDQKLYLINEEKKSNTDYIKEMLLRSDKVFSQNLFTRCLVEIQRYS